MRRVDEGRVMDRSVKFRAKNPVALFDQNSDPLDPGESP